MKISVIIMFLLAFAGPSFSAVKKKAKTKPVAKQHSSARPKTKSLRTRTSPRTRTKPAKTSAKSTGRAHATTAAPVASRSLQQGQPSPERYAEIQQALVAKGYLKNEATGQWTNESGAALKHFQSDQNLTPDGKLNSLSLIALGLGPKRTMTAQSQPEVRP